MSRRTLRWRGRWWTWGKSRNQCATRPDKEKVYLKTWGLYWYKELGQVQMTEVPLCWRIWGRIHWRFNLSLFTGVLPEKFISNCVNWTINDIVPYWETFKDFSWQCDAAFSEENQLMLLKQVGKLTKEFFQEFEQLAFTTRYTDTHHGDVLTKDGRRKSWQLINFRDEGLNRRGLSNTLHCQLTFLHNTRHPSHTD